MGVGVDVGVGVAVLAVRVGVAVGVGVGVAVGVGVTVRVAVAVGVGVGIAVGVGVTVRVGVAVGVGVGAGVAVRVSVGVAVRVGVRERRGVGEGVSVEVDGGTNGVAELEVSPTDPVSRAPKVEAGRGEITIQSRLSFLIWMRPSFSRVSSAPVIRVSSPRLSTSTVKRTSAPRAYLPSCSGSVSSDTFPRGTKNVSSRGITCRPFMKSGYLDGDVGTSLRPVPRESASSNKASGTELDGGSGTDSTDATAHGVGVGVGISGVLEVVTGEGLGLGTSVERITGIGVLDGSPSTGAGGVGNPGSCCCGRASKDSAEAPPPASFGRRPIRKSPSRPISVSILSQGTSVVYWTSSHSDCSSSYLRTTNR